MGWTLSVERRATISVPMYVLLVKQMHPPSCDVEIEPDKEQRNDELKDRNGHM